MARRRLAIGQRRAWLGQEFPLVPIISQYEFEDAMRGVVDEFTDAVHVVPVSGAALFPYSWDDATCKSDYNLAFTEHRQSWLTRKQGGKTVMKKFRAVAIVAMITLAACGGNGSGGGQSPGAQTKQSARSEKALASDYQTIVEQLYVAYFGRPADPGGLVNFENALLAANAPTDIQSFVTGYANSTSIRTLVDSFAASKESQALYGSDSTNAFVSAVFQNVLGRAPQASGLAFWSNAIDNGGLNRGDAALSIMAGALANNSAQGLLDAQLIANRLMAAADFTAQTTSQNAVGAYAGAPAAAAARTALSAVDANTDTVAYAAVINAAVASLNKTPGISLLAGELGGAGSSDGVASDARFMAPLRTAVDGVGNVYVADTGNNTIRRINAGVVTTLAGTPGVVGAADGVGSAASFSSPSGIATDSGGNVYVADSGNNTIRRITPAGVVTTLAGSSPSALASAQGVAQGQKTEVTTVVIVAALVDGVGAAARFYKPTGIAADGNGNLYVADTGNNAIRKVTPSGVVTTLAGSGLPGAADASGRAAFFNGPTGVAVDLDGNVYVADSSNDTLRKLTPAGAVTTLAGSAGVAGNVDGAGSAASFSMPYDVTIDGAGMLYVSNLAPTTNSPYPGAANGSIRKVTPAGVVTTLAASDGIGLAAVIDTTSSYGAYSVLVNGAWVLTYPSMSFYGNCGVTADASGNLYIADSINNTIRRISASGVVTTLAGAATQYGVKDGPGQAANFVGAGALAVDGAGNVYVGDGDFGSPASFRIAISTYPAFKSTDGNGIHQISAAGVATMLANGVMASGMAVDSAGNIYAGDYFKNTINKISPTGVATPLAGSEIVFGAADGTGAAASFARPAGVALDGAGNIYAADTGNGTIRKITAAGVVTTLAGTAHVLGSADGVGAAASFNYPYGIAVDGGGTVYVADLLNNNIRKIAPSGTVTTLAGAAGNGAFADGSGAAARFNAPVSLAVDGAGNVYVADRGNNAIRKITAAGVVTTIAGKPGAGGVTLGALPGRLNQPGALAIDSAGVLYVRSEGAVLKIRLP
jgi:sugar lactone lactonase YvrE